MAKTPPTNKPIRNPQTRQRHRQEVLWQITVPLLAGSAILLILSLLTTTLGSIEASFWSSISVIWLIIPVMLLALISFVFLAASVYATVRLIQVLPYYSYQALTWLILFGSNIHRLTDRMVEPVLKAHSLSASVKMAGRQARRR